MPHSSRMPRVPSAGHPSCPRARFRPAAEDRLPRLARGGHHADRSPSSGTHASVSAKTWATAHSYDPHPGAFPVTRSPRHLRWAVNGARTFDVPTDATRTVLAEIDRAVRAAHFRPDAPLHGSGAQAVYRRGSALGDVLIGGSGLSAITTRLGPLSVHGVVVVSLGERDPDSARVIISLVAGSHVGGDFVDAVEDALRLIHSRGVPVDDTGWSRAVDIERTSPANPRRATELGLV